MERRGVWLGAVKGGVETGQRGYNRSGQKKGAVTAVGFSPFPLLLQQRSAYLLLPPHFPAGRQGNELLSAMQYMTF